MLQFPYAVYPNGQTLDGSIENKFSCMISGTKCTAYQIKIYDNNTNTLIYTGTKTNVSKYNQELLEMNVPVNSFGNGKDLTWSARLWTTDYDMQIASSKVISVNSSTNIAIEPYSTSRIKIGQVIKFGEDVYTITNYQLNADGSYGLLTVDSTMYGIKAGDNFKIYSDFIDMPTYFFKARSLPVVSILSLPTNINSRNYSFKGVYSQSENVGIQYYIFNLYDNLEKIADTTGKKYSANIEYNYDGFINGNDYYIELICVTQDNVEVTTGMKKFSVSYSQPNIDVGIGYEILNDKDAIRLILEPDKTSIPKFSGKYSIIPNMPFNGTNSARLEDSELIYDNISENPLSIDDSSFSVFMSTRLDNNFQGKVVELSNSSTKRFISLLGYTFYDNNNTTSTKILQIYNTDKFLLQASVEDNTGYIWDDSPVWNDNYYWCEPKEGLDKKQFKINILPTTSTILEV